MSRNKKTKKILMFVLLVNSILLIVGGKSKADFVFSKLERLGPTVNTSAVEAEPSISADGLSLYFNSDRPGGSDGWDLWVTTRETTNDDWGEPVNLGPTVNSWRHDVAPCISADGLSLYFTSNRSGDYDAWITTRATIDQSWGDPVNLGLPVNLRTSMDVAFISPDGLELYICSNRSGGYGNTDLWVSIRVTTDDDWEEPVNLGSTVNAASGEVYASISSDGLMLFFSGGDAPPRAGGYGESDIWVTRRKTKDANWGTPVNLGATVNSSSVERAPSISADGSTLYFCSNRGGYDLWQASIDPVVDLNGDGIVDATDMCIIVDNWGTDNQLCDIGPMPWGDGIVDVQDLIVLSQHLFEDYLAMPHWKLDEETGNIAHDNPGVHDGKLHGGPLWQPTGGMIDGALELDGIDDYISTDFILDPSAGAFSVFGWVKGGAPGQVIISQLNGTIWLGLDAESGAVMTGLVPPSSGWVRKKPLVSDSIITDDLWHHVGFVWDGSYRILYVDGMEVAKDASAQNPLISADGGLYIGASQALSASTFFTGLIDDIHIYDVALTAEEIAALVQ